MTFPRRAALAALVLSSSLTSVAACGGPEGSDHPDAGTGGAGTTSTSASGGTTTGTSAGSSTTGTGGSSGTTGTGGSSSTTGTGGAGGGLSNVEVLFEANAFHLLSVAIDDTTAYAGGDQGLVAVPKSGGAAVMLDLTPGVVGVAVSASHVYYTTRSSNAGDVRRIPKAGGAPEVIHTSSLEPWSIAVSGDRVYFTEVDIFAGAGCLRSAPLDGSAPPIAIDCGLCDPGSVAIGDGHVYVANFNCVDGELVRFPVGAARRRRSPTTAPWASRWARDTSSGATISARSSGVRRREAAYRRRRSPTTSRRGWSPTRRRSTWVTRASRASTAASCGSRPTGR
ncbi:Hypothetical protein A7982_06185 [Minicystis rosea]|nr:Hypothetical protein A7982_06185 [Minicystis rosea]